jgi:hypothetical protein
LVNTLEKFGIGAISDMKKTEHKSDNCLDILINSCKKRAAPFTTATENVCLNFYRNKNDNVLIFIGSLNKDIEHECMSDLNVISKEELFLSFDKGCVGPTTIDYMLESFNEYHDKSVLGDISAFLQSLEAIKITICYADSMGVSKAALLVLYKICQQLDIKCLPIIIKPALFKGISSSGRHFKDLLTYIGAHEYHIYDEDFSVYTQRHHINNIIDFQDLCKVELLKFATSIL